MNCTRPNLHIGKSTGDLRRCIIDVGSSHTGIRGKYFKSKLNLPVIFIDADQVALHKLQVEPDDLVVNAAVSSRNGLAKFNIYPHDGTGSLCEVDLKNATAWAIGNRKSTQEDWTCQEINIVPMVTLGDIIETMGIEQIAALKIDAQGHDFEVVKGIGQHFDKVNYIELEVQIVQHELYKNSSKKEEVIEFLKNQEFDLIATSLHSWNQEQNICFLRKGTV
jgi:FkbM family methyltransferase